MVGFSPKRMPRLKLHFQDYLDLAATFYDIKSLGKVGSSSTNLNFGEICDIF
jgi:hypothetical protein